MDYPCTPLRLNPKAGGSLLDKALAKPFDRQRGLPAQSYRQHVTDVFRAWHSLVVENSSFIESFCSQREIKTERFLQSSLLTVALHDLGKLTVNFQGMMDADKRKARSARKQNYRHEIAGIWFVRHMAQRLLQEFGPIVGGGNLEVMAVAGHHKYHAPVEAYDTDNYQQELAWLSSAQDCIRATYFLAKDFFAAMNWELPTPRISGSRQDLSNLLHDPSSDRNPPIECLQNVKSSINRSATDKRCHNEFREAFIVTKGLLMTADWMASGSVSKPDLLQAATGTLSIPHCALASHASETLPSFDGWRPFQNQCGDARGNVLAIAPTGSGKTEASLLWSLNQCEHHGKRKLLFLLPTMVTSNALHQRLDSFFDKHGHRVGLVHSMADLFHENLDSDTSEADRNRSETLVEKHLFFPVTVGTVDQLLTTLFHTGRWAMKTLAAANAAIVIDEIHAYDPHTAGLLMLAIKQLRELGSSFMVMTATMPADLQSTIAHSLGPETTIVREETLLNSARNTWTTSDETLVERLTTQRDNELVPSKFLQGLMEQRSATGTPLRVLIVTNNVDKCQTLARTLRHYSPVCYHSRFIARDRATIEKKIIPERPQLLVATQVVEVSLDIDYDILLTECAPPDAMAQRAGRVNRGRRAELGKIIIHAPDEKSRMVYKEPDGILDSAWSAFRESEGELTEQDLIGLVERVYSGHQISAHSEYLAIQSSTKECQRRMAGVFDNPRPWEDDENGELKTRLEKYKQISVVPSTHVQEAIQVFDETPKFLRNFEVKLPYWYYSLQRDPDVTELPIPVCKVEYDPLVGVKLLEADAVAESQNLVI